MSNFTLVLFSQGIGLPRLLFARLRTHQDLQVRYNTTQLASSQTQSPSTLRRPHGTDKGLSRDVSKVTDRAGRT